MISTDSTRTTAARLLRWFRKARGRGRSLRRYFAKARGRAATIRRLVAERGDARAESERLRAIVDRLHHSCGMEMADETQGPSQTCCEMWSRIEEAAEAARKTRCVQ